MGSSAGLRVYSLCGVACLLFGWPHQAQAQDTPVYNCSEELGDLSYPPPYDSGSAQDTMELLVQLVEAQLVRQEGLHERVDLLCTSGAFSYTTYYADFEALGFVSVEACNQAGIGCKEPEQTFLTDGCMTRVSGYDMELNHHMQVDAGFATALGDVESLADCYLTPAEIARDPEAQALVAAWQAKEAAELGVNPSAVHVSGISLDDDTMPGCSSAAVAEVVTSGGGLLMPTLRIRLDNSLYDTSLSNPLIHGGAEPCHLTPDEIGMDTDATILAGYFTNAVCEQLNQMNPSNTACEVGTGIKVTGIDLANCGTAGVEETCIPTDDDADATVIGACANALSQDPLPLDYVSATGSCFRSDVAHNSDMPSPAYPLVDRVHNTYAPSADTVSVESGGQNYHDVGLAFPENLIQTIRGEDLCEKTGNTWNASGLAEDVNGNADAYGTCTDINGIIVNVTMSADDDHDPQRFSSGEKVPINVHNCPTGMSEGLCPSWAQEMCESTGNHYSPEKDTTLSRFYCERVYAGGYDNENYNDPANPAGQNGTCTYTMAVTESDTFVTAPEISIQVTELFANGLASAVDYSDCFISPEELSPAGSAFLGEVIGHQERLLDTPEMCIAVQQMGTCITFHTYTEGTPATCITDSGEPLPEWDSSEAGCVQTGFTYLPEVNQPGADWVAPQCLHSDGSGTTPDADVFDVDETCTPTSCPCSLSTGTCSLEACTLNNNIYSEEILHTCLDIDGNNVVQWGGRWGEETEQECEHGDPTSATTCEKTGFQFVPAVAPDDLYPHGQPARCLETETSALQPGYSGWVVGDDDEAECTLTGHQYSPPAVLDFPANLTTYCAEYTEGDAESCITGARTSSSVAADDGSYIGEGHEDYAVNETCSFVPATTFPEGALSLLGISMDSDTEVGCQSGQGLGGGVEIALGGDLVNALTGGVDLTESSTVDADDINLDDPNDPLAQLANNFLAAICESMGFTPGTEECDSVQLDGISFAFCSGAQVQGGDQLGDGGNADECAAVEGNDRAACLNTNEQCRFALDPECGPGSPELGSEEFGLYNGEPVCDDASCSDPAALCRGECYASSNGAMLSEYNPTCSASLGAWAGTDGGRRRVQGHTVAFDDLLGHVKVKPTWKFKNGDRFVKVQLARNDLQ